MRAIARTHPHARSRSAPLGLAGVAAALAAVLCGWAIAQIPGEGLVGPAPVALLVVLTGGTLIVLAHAARTGQLLAPLGLVALTALVYFVARPLELALSAGELVRVNYNYFASPLEQVSTIPGQEISLFVHTRMSGGFDGALTRALLAVTLFFGCLLAGYRLRIGRLLAARAARIGAAAGALDVRWVVAAWLAIGLVGQALIVARIGGVGTAVSQLATQGNLAVGFGYLVILNFFTVGLVMWICWRPPADRGGRILLGAAICELAGFYALLGSRTLVLVPLLLVLLAWNEIRKPWRLRVLVLGALAAILFASSYLSLREESRNTPLIDAIANIPEHAVDARTILNASPVFDQLFMATNTVPARAPYRYGGEIAQGALGQVPRFVYPGKPDANDTSFRRLIWGETFKAGRPIGAVGEFYRDFGFAGIIIGALLLGVLARGLTGLRAAAGGERGRELRAAVFVLSLVLLYQFLVGSYSIVFGQALAMGIPLLLAIKVFARPA